MAVVGALRGEDAVGGGGDAGAFEGGGAREGTPADVPAARAAGGAVRGAAEGAAGDAAGGVGEAAGGGIGLGLGAIGGAAAAGFVAGDGGAGLGKIGAAFTSVDGPADGGGELSTNFSTTCRRANSTSLVSISSISMMSRLAAEVSPCCSRGGTADSRMSLARVSISKWDSPAGKVLGSSANLASALNTSPQRPQRTWPPAARSTSADKRNIVSHFEHCVYKLSRSPGVNAAPVVPPKHLNDIKTGRVCGFHRVGLRLQQSGKHEISAPLAGRPKHRE